LKGKSIKLKIEKKIGRLKLKMKQLQGKGKEKGGIHIPPPGGTLSHYATAST